MDFAGGRQKQRGEGQDDAKDDEDDGCPLLAGAASGTAGMRGTGAVHLSVCQSNAGESLPPSSWALKLATRVRSAFRVTVRLAEVLPSLHLSKS